jgi:hypothetical protein
MGRACSTHRREVLVVKPEDQKPLARFGYRLEDNIKTDLKTIGIKGTD